ncbi:hypothetical protein GOM71_11935 [Paenibacillus sp. NEAU-GSW1]|nr:hypothetical protein [Paenibacillus sp. NEAU-GSW1]
MIEYMHRQLDGDLDEQEQQLLLKHTRQCPDCAAMFERLKKLSSELENLPKVMPSYSLVDAILPQLEMLDGPRFSDAASVETVQEQARDKGNGSVAARRRRWPAWISGVAAAGAVAMFFVISYSGGMFQSVSKDEAASSTAAEAQPAAALQQNSASDEENVLEPYSFDLQYGKEVGVESMDKAPAAADESTSNKLKTDSSEDQKAKSFTGDVIDNGAETTVTVNKSAKSVAGETDKSEERAAAADTVASSDGVYVASAKEPGNAVQISKGEDIVFKSTVKSGKVTLLSWSEDNSKLTYEVQLDDKSGVETYIVDIATLEEKKAD